MEKEQHPRYADNHSHIRTYENFCPICPYCNRRNIFNRADDFGTFRPIASRLVSCQYEDCGREFLINADLVSSKHEYLIRDCSHLKEQKRYMYCILNLCQACEAYFSLYIKAKLVFEVYGNKIFESWDQLNKILDELYSALSRSGYQKLRNFVINHYLADPEVTTVSEVREQINLLSDKDFTSTPPRDNLNEIQPDKLREAFVALYDFDIHTQRNKVVHAKAFRPGRDLVDEYYVKTRNIIFVIDRFLRIKDEIEDYRPPNYILI